MHLLARACAVWLATCAAGATFAAPPSPAPLPRIVVAFANEPHAAPGTAGTTGSHYGGDGYRVAQSAQQQARGLAAAYSLRQVASWPIKALSMHCVVYEVTDGRSVPELLAALSKDQRVVLAQPLQEFHTLTGAPAADAPYNDPLYDLQTNLLALGIARAHERTQGAGVHVALIDTAVDAEHPDLRGRILHRRSFLASHEPAAGFQRHGTAMAGLIAAVANNHVGIVGIAPLAQIEVFEACWQLKPDSDAAACNTFTLAQALAAALASGAPLVNLSLAGPADPLLSALVQSGLRRGVIFVGAASDDAGFPTAIPGVIAASGSEHPLPHGALAAPAEHVLTLGPGGQYDFVSGTSVAAAELTGVIALLISASPARLASSTIVSLLQEGAEHPQAPALDINAALARLDAQQHRGAVAARAPH
jgi:subtilisin family serine protease